MTFSGELCALRSVQLFDLVIAIVERIGEMRGCPAGFASSNGTIIDDYDRTTRAGEQIRSGHPCDASPYDTDVGPEVLGELWEVGRIACGHPDGGRAAGVASHAMNFGRMIAVECYRRVVWRIGCASATLTT